MLLFFFKLSKSFLKIFIIKPVGVTTKKKMMPITIGATNFPKINPNLNQILFKGSSNFEFNRPNIKKINDKIKDQILILFSLNIGQVAMIKKTIQKTIPKFLFDGNLIFRDLN